jgi:hypothetical protein
MDNEEEAQWMAVIAKSLAVLAMHRSELGNSEMMVKAEFLEGLGLSRGDVASMLGTTTNSLSVMSSRKKKKGSKRGKIKKS